MSELLSVPLKKPSEVDVATPLKNLVRSSFSTTENTVEYAEPINEFGKLRNTAIWKAFEKYEASLEIIYSYYDQICGLETKIPTHELQIPFKWKDAFDKGAIFGGRISLTVSSLAYEKVCILFNIAALQSAIASNQGTQSDEGLKLAAKLFQQSAGIFAYLKGITPAAIPQEPTPDLNPETLQALSNLMIAQAQEIFVIKAIRDSLKDAIIAKLASQCEELYADALRGLQKDSLRSMWDKEWIPIVAGKQAGFHAMAELYQSLVCRSNKAVGEEIARLQHAVELFKAAQSRSGKSTLFDVYAGRAQRNLTESKKDNDMIYNEMIPDVKNLEMPGKALVAKMMPFKGERLSAVRKDLFVDLVPIALQQAITTCEARKNELVNAEIMKLRDATQILNGVLANLNLPAAIEVTPSGSLPQSLLQKSEEVRQKGGIDSIRQLLNDLPELLKRNRELLDECERMLNEERDSDTQMQTQFKTRWSRVPSEKLTASFWSAIGKYRETIEKAVIADRTVRETFEKYSNGIEILSKSPEEMNAAVPSGDSAINVSNCTSVQKLRQLMEGVETIKAERDVIESELKSATVNMKEEFMVALEKDGAINEPALSIAQIGKSLGPLSTQVQESISRQEALIADVQTAHQQFKSERGGCDERREQFLSDLQSAYNNYVTLRGHLEDGTEFYNNLTKILVNYQTKISDFCFARKTEKDELLKDLTQESTRTPAVIPAVPSHYEPTRPAPSTPASGGTTGGISESSNSTPSVPYPVQMQGMPLPYGATAAVPYPTYILPPMPTGFNPYATLPYPTNPYNYQGFPQGPQHYGTYPGSLAAQQGQPQPGYPPQPGYQPQPGYPR